MKKLNEANDHIKKHGMKKVDSNFLDPNILLKQEEYEIDKCNWKKQLIFSIKQKNIKKQLKFMENGWV